MTPHHQPRPLLATAQSSSVAVKVSAAELHLLQASVCFSLRYTRDPVLASQLGQLASGRQANAAAA